MSDRLRKTVYVKQCSNVFQCFYVRIVLVAMECLSMVILNIFYFIIIYLFWNYLCTLNSYIYYLMYYNFEVIFEFEMFELSLFELCCCFTPEFRVVSLKKTIFWCFFYIFFLLLNWLLLVMSLKTKIKVSNHFSNHFSAWECFSHKNAFISFSISRQLFLVRASCTKLPITKRRKMRKTQNLFLIKDEILMFLLRYFMCP